MSLIIHAPSVHEGGGRSLLIALLTALGRQSGTWKEVMAIFDRRFDSNLVQAAHLTVLNHANPGFMGRLCAERILAATAQPDDVVLCFGNIPPVHRLNCCVLTYVQNFYITETDLSDVVPWLARLRIRLLRMWLRALQNHSDFFLVQTESMRDALIRWGGIAQDRVKVAPFAEGLASETLQNSDQSSREWDFGYVAKPWPHKNHYRLVEAFILLAQEGIKPSLVVTVPWDMDKKLADFIEQAREVHGVRIINLGYVANERIHEIYSKIKALIFPSLGETIGLPLLEAKSYGLPIVASERDYVRDVVEPVGTFDPKSPRSIKRAVLRFMGQPEKPRAISRPDEFLDNLLQISAQWERSRR